jgi:hypothetical protein
MSGFIASDGSEVVGGFLPSGAGQGLALDSSGNLKIVGSISATNPSVSATAAAVPASATYVGGNKAGNLVGFSLDASGYLNVNVQTGGGSNASVGVDGAAIPLSSTMIGASDGTNLQQLLVESSTRLNLRTALYNGANELGISAGGQGQFQLVDSAGTNVAGVDGSNRLKTIISSALPAGAAILGQIKLVDTGGANQLAIDGSGRLTLVPNSSVNVAQIAGVAPGLDNTNEQRVSVYGKNAAAGDTPFLVDASGRLQDNIVQWGGTAPGINNPVITEDQVRFWINNGQGYTATTTKLTAGGAITGGLSVFNPNASGKTLLILAIRYMVGNNNFDQVNFTTSDPALGTSVTALNLKAAAAAGVAVCSSANTNVAPAGTQFATVGGASNVMNQMLFPDTFIIIPANNGLAFYSNLSGANSWFVDITWVEF